MSANSIICTAIGSRHTIGFEYLDSEGNYYHRTVEPYAHGVNNQGKDALYAYQIAGTSERLETLPGWRTFLVERMRSLKFGHAFREDVPGYEHYDRHFSSIHCRVQ